jgi:hypothetical protein
MTQSLIDIPFQERQELALEFLQEQVMDQRRKLRRWRALTNQPAQIDTGYIAQHLVSLVTGVLGSGMRGKGDDLEDGSEVKSANFLDSLDARGATSPRWNFQSNDLASMEKLLSVPSLYISSFDLSMDSHLRIRVWAIDPKLHAPFRERYIEWMNILGKPKLLDPRRPYANFQLFPPALKSNDTFARHGQKIARPFSQLRIELESPPMSRKLFHAEETRSGQLQLLEI